MAKIAFDKYYTPPTVARWCIEKTKEIIGEENITEWVEPSAGCGMFSHQIPGCKAYDLYPQHEYIEQSDFLELDLGGTSFTIYKRNDHKNDFRDQIERTELKDVTFIKLGRKNKDRDNHKKNIDYDYCFSSFGTLFLEKRPYETAGQIVVKIHNLELKDKIITFLKWLYYEDKESEIMSRKCVGSKNVDIEDLKKLMKICIPEIK